MTDINYIVDRVISATRESPILLAYVGGEFRPFFSAVVTPDHVGQDNVVGVYAGKGMYKKAIKAMIVTKRENLTEKEVLAYCRAHLEDFMVPNLIEFCDQLPKTSSGKIRKVGLAKTNTDP